MAKSKFDVVVSSGGKGRSVHYKMPGGTEVRATNKRIYENALKAAGKTIARSAVTGRFVTASSKPK